MKNVKLYFVGVLLLVYLGIALPYLVSAPSDIAVILAVISIPAVASATVWFLKKNYNEKE